MSLPLDSFTSHSVLLRNLFALSPSPTRASSESVAGVLLIAQSSFSLLLELSGRQRHVVSGFVPVCRGNLRQPTEFLHSFSARRFSDAVRNASVRTNNRDYNRIAAYKPLELFLTGWSSRVAQNSFHLERQNSTFLYLNHKKHTSKNPVLWHSAKNDITRYHGR